MISGGVFCLKKQPEKRFSRFQAAFAFKAANIFQAASVKSAGSLKTINGIGRQQTTRAAVPP